MIRDVGHPIVQHIAELRKRSGRDRTGLVIVEGKPEVVRAHQAGVPMRKLVYCRELSDLEATDFSADEHIEVSKEVFAACAFGTRLKGIIAICQPEPLCIADLQLSDCPLILALEGVEKPSNLGAVLRTADAAKVDAVVLIDGRTDIFNQHVVRSSIGLVFHVPVTSATRSEAYEFFRARQLPVFAATSRAEQAYTDCRLDNPAVILVGNEHEGLSEFWLEAADSQTLIPMGGHGACLNVTVSASILLFEARRQRALKKAGR